MARVVGESGAWRAIRCRLERHQLLVSNPEDITPLHLQLQESYQPSVERIHSVAAEQKAKLAQEIEKLQGAKDLWRKIWNWFVVRRLRADIALLEWKVDSQIDYLDTQLQLMVGIENSPELGGALAELEVIRELEQLPDSHVVLNDVHLRATRYIHYNGNALQSAQIDHMVISPAGVFVIETKLWSEKFAQTSHYHNPFDQVQRAGFLCYDLLKSRYGKTRVRSLIACGGHLPEAPEKSRVKVLRFPQLNGYITWFKKEELSPAFQARLCEYFQGFVNR